MISINKPSFIAAVFFVFLTFGAEAGADQPPFKIVSQNLNRFFDDKDDGNNEKILTQSKYQKRMHQLMTRVKSHFDFAEIIAFQEIENLRILKQLSNMLHQRYRVRYEPILIEGNDRSGMDVGFLVKKTVNIKSVKSLFKDKKMGDYPKYLFSRPPLVLEICSNKCLTIVNLHLRSMRGLRSSKKSQYVATKRKHQAETLAQWVNQFQKSNPDERLLLLGDFNALTPSDNYVDVMGTIIGTPNTVKPRYVNRDWVDNDLIDITLKVKPSKRYSYIYKKKKQLLDYALITKNLENNIQHVKFSWIDYKFSDHSTLTVDLLL